VRVCVYLRACSVHWSMPAHGTFVQHHMKAGV
jgi:hypothetical protein